MINFLVSALLIQSFVANIRDRTVDLGPLLVSDREIVVPGLPDGTTPFNPTMARTQDGTFLVFRLDRYDLSAQVQMDLAVVRLDKDYQVQGPYHLLDTRQIPWLRHSSEDPRLAVVDDKLFVIYNAEIPDPFGRRRGMFMAQIVTRQTPEGEDIWAQDIRQLDVPQNQRTEKNWVPFVADGELRFIYHTNPPHIFRLKPEDLRRTRPRVLLEEVSRLFEAKKFKWGAMRGGTGATRTEDFDFDYLAFFHLRDNADWGGGKRMHYATGVYTFAPEPPHHITRLLPFPLIPSPMDNAKNPRIEIAYPGGYLMDDETIAVCYGFQDRAIRLMTLDRALLVEALNAPSAEPIDDHPQPMTSTVSPH